MVALPIHRLDVDIEADDRFRQISSLPFTQDDSIVRFSVVAFACLVANRQTAFRNIQVNRLPHASSQDPPEGRQI